MVKRMEYCRWEVRHHMSPEKLELGFSESQFLSRCSKLAFDWDLNVKVLADSVTDILKTKGGKAGRFKW